MTTPADERPHWLPDFCSLPVLFAVMVVAELLALVVLIAPSDETRPLVPRLATASLFVQWLALGALCVCASCGRGCSGTRRGSALPPPTR